VSYNNKFDNNNNNNNYFNEKLTQSK